MDSLLELGLFTAKAVVILLITTFIFIAFFSLLAKAKEKIRGRLVIRSLNQKYEEIKEAMLAEVLEKKQFKQFKKEQKAKEKADAKSDKEPSKVYVVHFHGDIKASAVSNLSEEITAILNVATPNDEVVVNVESPGGVVHGYGLAAAQLLRVRARGIPLTVCVDKVAASGGYLMACVANKIYSAPFAIIGSIGVIVQLPNFHRLLRDKHIDFEQHTAGEFKRTITMFGHNTDEGRQKLQEEIEDIHGLFKKLIAEHRQQVNIDQVATGEHWLGQQALELKLVDAIKTSDDYLLERSKEAKLFEVCYEVKKPFMSKMAGAANLLSEKLFTFNWVR